MKTNASPEPATPPATPPTQPRPETPPQPEEPSPPATPYDSVEPLEFAENSGNLAHEPLRDTMTHEEFYSSAFLASLPIAAQLYPAKTTGDIVKEAHSMALEAVALLARAVERDS
jgi:hypothetical protein